MYLPDQNNPEGSTVPCRNKTKKHPFPRFPTILPIPVPVLLPVTVPDRLPRFSFLSAIYRKKLLLPLTVCEYLLLSLRSKEPVHMPDIPQAFLYFQWISDFPHQRCEGYLLHHPTVQSGPDFLPSAEKYQEFHLLMQTDRYYPPDTAVHIPSAPAVPQVHPDPGYLPVQYAAHCPTPVHPLASYSSGHQML